MEAVRKEFLDLSDKFYKRFTERLEGLTDEEYLWEPAPDSWSLRRGADGKLALHWGLVFDEVAPVTTIAWRYVHIIDLLSEDRCANYLGLEPETENIFADGVPGDAKTARKQLEQAFARWKRYVEAMDIDHVFDAIGQVGGQWGNNTRAMFVLHIIDEAIHHGAEIGVLRDVYRAERSFDPVVSSLLRGENVDEDTVAKARSELPDLMLRAAAYAEWDAIPRLIDLGFPIDGRDGRTPLHHAAAEGRIDLMRLLIDHGADINAKDPIYKATPLVWAEFFNRTEAADFLRSVVPQ